MSEAWSVNNPGVQEANLVLAQAVQECGAIKADLEHVLSTMSAATQNSAVPLWADLVTQWDATYNEMNLQLGSTSSAGHGAHEAYLWGDRQSVFLMQ